MDGKRTVVVLGAGASAGSLHRLPTMASFWPDVATLPDQLRRFLLWFRAPSVDDNLENVLSYLELARLRGPLWGVRTAPPGVDPGRCYEEVLEQLSQRLATPPGSQCPTHVELVKRLESQDSIITFNYDLIADAALGAASQKGAGQGSAEDRLQKLGQLVGNPRFVGGEPPSLLPQEVDSGFYLKLHGSLDWLRCPSIGCPNNQRIFVVGAETLREGQSAGRPCRLCGAGLQIFVVPPVAAKRVEDRGRLAFLWHLALREMQAAEHLVIAGLSLAATDFDLRWLLRTATADRTLPILTVLNPNNEHRKAVASLVPCGSLRSFDTLSEFLDPTQSQSQVPN